MEMEFRIWWTSNGIYGFRKQGANRGGEEGREGADYAGGENHQILNVKSNLVFLV